MTDILRSADAHWSGDLRGGKGSISTESQVLKNQSYGFSTRFENSPGTNPEELIAAAHAACYSMALSYVLSQNGFVADSIHTQATCVFTPQALGGYKITGMRLSVRGRVPGCSAEKFQSLCKDADQGCPVSNLLRSGLTIALDASLEE